MSAAAASPGGGAGAGGEESGMMEVIQAPHSPPSVSPSSTTAMDEAQQNPRIKEFLEKELNQHPVPFSITHTRLSLTILPTTTPTSLAALTIAGEIEMTLKPRTNRSSLSVMSEGIRLNARGLRILSASICGVPVTFHHSNTADVLLTSEADGSVERRDADTLTAALRASVATSIKSWPRDLQVTWIDDSSHPFSPTDPDITLSLQYECVILGGMSAGGMVLSNSPHRHVFCERNSDPGACSLWMPCISHHNEQCTWSIDILTDPNWTVLGPGDLSGIETVQQGTRKRFHFEVGTPTAANRIGFALGPFEGVMDNNDRRIYHACLPGRLDHLTATCSDVATKAMKFYEQLLEMPYPYPWYCQVFVHDAPAELAGSFAGLTVFSDELLFGPDVLDLGERIRERIAIGLAEQFFGCAIAPHSPARDTWLVLGLAEWAAKQFLSKHLGESYHRARLLRETERCTSASSLTTWTGTVWKRSVCGNDTDFVHPVEMETGRMRERYGLLVRLLERNIGSVLSLVTCLKLALPPPPASMLLGTSKLMKAVKEKVKVDLKQFEERWIKGYGIPEITAGFFFDKRKHTTDLGVRYETNVPSTVLVGGPLQLTVRIHEQGLVLDQKYPLEFVANTFEYVWETQLTRKPTKKSPNEIPSLAAGTFIQAPSSSSASTSTATNKQQTTGPLIPILWMRVDPDLDLIRHIHFRQSEEMWLTQLKEDKDVIAQIEAVRGLMMFPSSVKCIAKLYETIQQKQKMYWRVRVAALHALSVFRGGGGSGGQQRHEGYTHLMELMKSQSTKGPDNQTQLQPRPNSVADMATYHITQEVALALAEVRLDDGLSPPDAFESLLFQLENNDNTGCSFTDSYLLASLITALGNLALRAPEREVPQARQTLERLLEMDTIVPSHGNVKSIACLRSLAKLCGHAVLPVLIEHVQVYHPYVVRKAAVDGLCHCLTLPNHLDENLDLFEKLLNLFEQDASYRLKKHIASALLLCPLDKSLVQCLRCPSSDDAQMTAMVRQMIELLWRVINTSITAYEPRLRCRVLDLYIHLWGNGTPLPLWRDDIPQLCVPERHHTVIASSSSSSTAMGTMTTAAAMTATSTAITPSIGPTPTPNAGGGPGRKRGGPGSGARMPRTARAKKGAAASPAPTIRVITGGGGGGGGGGGSARSSPSASPVASPRIMTADIKYESSPVIQQPPSPPLPTTTAEDLTTVALPPIISPPAASVEQPTKLKLIIKGLKQEPK